MRERKRLERMKWGEIGVGQLGCGRVIEQVDQSRLNRSHLGLGVAVGGLMRRGVESENVEDPGEGL